MALEYEKANRFDSLELQRIQDKSNEELLESKMFQDAYSADGISKVNYFKGILELWQQLNKVTGAAVIVPQEFDELRVSLGVFRSQFNSRVTTNHQYISPSDVYYVMKSIGQMDASLDLKMIKIKSDTTTVEKIVELLGVWSRLPRADKDVQEGRKNDDRQPRYYEGLNQFLKLFENVNFQLSSAGNQDLENTIEDNQWPSQLTNAILADVDKGESDTEAIKTQIHSVISQFRRSNSVSITGRTKAMLALYTPMALEFKKSGRDTLLLKYITENVDISLTSQNQINTEVSIASSGLKKLYLTQIYRMLRYPKNFLYDKKNKLEKIVDSITSGMIDSDETMWEKKILLLTSLVKDLSTSYSEIQSTLNISESDQEADRHQLNFDITSYNEQRRSILYRLTILARRTDLNTEQYQQVIDLNGDVTEFIVKKELPSPEQIISNLESRIIEVEKLVNSLSPKAYVRNKRIYRTGNELIQSLKLAIETSCLIDSQALLNRVAILEGSFNNKNSELMADLIERRRNRRFKAIKTCIVDAQNTKDRTRHQKIAGLTTVLNQLKEDRANFDPTQQVNQSYTKQADFPDKANFALTMSDFDMLIREIEAALEV